MCNEVLVGFTDMLICRSIGNLLKNTKHTALCLAKLLALDGWLECMLQGFELRQPFFGNVFEVLLEIRVDGGDMFRTGREPRK